MNVLVVNCGSSSLKFQLINSETEAVAAKGSVRAYWYWTEDWYISQQEEKRK